MLLERFFELGNDGEFHQKRLGKERDFLRKRSEKQAETAKKRWAKINENKDIVNATVMSVAYAPTPTPTPTPIIEEKKDTIVSQKKPPPHGCRLPDDWTPGDDGLNFAIQEGFSHEAAMRAFESFRDYWTAKTGADACKRDWQATWRNWVRRSHDAAKRAPGGNGFSSGGERVGPLTAAMRKFATED